MGTTGHRKTESRHRRRWRTCIMLSGSCAGNKKGALLHAEGRETHGEGDSKSLREAPESKDTATSLRRARAASLKAMANGV